MTHRHTHLSFPSLSIAALALLAGLVASVSVAGGPRVPVGFDAYITMVADGEFALGSAHPEVPGCDGLVPGFCDGTYYWEEIVGATPGERLAEEAEAKLFMSERFGLDVDALAASGEILWIDSYADPRYNYRARTIAGQQVHEYGWKAHDQAFTVIANVELALGGEFVGHTLPPGSMLVQGRYLIRRSQLDWVDGSPVLTEDGAEILIEFQSGAPVVANADLRYPIVGNCELTSSPWGRGLALVSALRSTEDGVIIKNSIRNMMLFDGVDGFGSYPGVELDPDLTLID